MMERNFAEEGVPLGAEAIMYFKLTYNVFPAGNSQDKRREELYEGLQETCKTGNVGKAKQILREAGPDAEVIVNTTPNGCSTLLFKACEDGQKEIVSLLVDHGADGRIHPVTKYSPLYISCYYGRKTIAEILLKKFPELVQVPTVEHWLPIHAAAINGHCHVLELLLKFPYPSYVMQKFIDKSGTWEYNLPFDINAKDVAEQTVLYLSCYVGNLRLVDTLVKYRVRGKKKLKQNIIDSQNKHEENLDLKTSPGKFGGGLQHILAKLSLRNNLEDPVQPTELYISPLDIDLYCANNTETALHVSVKHKQCKIASLLLQNGANPNLRIALSEEDLNHAQDENYVFSGSSTLVEACKNRDLTMVDLLVRYGARDDDCSALKVASKEEDEKIISKLLTLKAHQDPEYKINKKILDITPSTQLGGGLMGGVTFSSMFPTIPVMINWHSQRCLQFVKEQWIIDASVSLNIKLKLSPHNHSMALSAITRLDISNNELTELPACIFQMPSLRVLNASQNKVEKLPDIEIKSQSGSVLPNKSSQKLPSKYKLPATWTCSVLEEIHLQENRLDNVPEGIFQLPSLIILDLSNNKLQMLPFKVWSSPKLRELNLSLNLLKSLPCFPSYQPDAAVYKERLEDQFTSSSESSLHHTSLELIVQENIPTVLKSESYGSKTTPLVASRGNSQMSRSCEDLLHHNIWSRSVEVVDVPLDSKLDKDQHCQLSSLNLSHNAFEVIPPVLACFALSLARLNLSYNCLREMGPVKNYPANLKHLDLSHNMIQFWPTLKTVQNEGMHDEIVCYNLSENESPSRTPSAPSPVPGSTRREINRLRNSNLGSQISGTSSHLCIHHRHNRLDNLRTLILADNQLTRLLLTAEDEGCFEEEESRSQDSFDTMSISSRDSQGAVRSRVLFPNLSMLDVGNNQIQKIPVMISDLTNLSVLNISGNIAICKLPPEMGLLSKLWNLNTRDCNLNDPLKSMIESKKYKTMDIIGYLKSILEDSKAYARMKLMIVGVQGIGKTSLLEQLRQEGTGTYKRKPPEHWAKRMGNKHINLKTAKGVSISTVGVDVGDWIYEKKLRGQPSYGPVTFRTWDFGGQKEYYATHQYFLSKRSLYLVVWRITDGECGVKEIHQWLVNIQARAPNAPVIVVGTHYDLAREKFSLSYCNELQQMIREHYINVVDADKCGLPRVLETIEISCKSRHNIKLLCNVIYDIVFELRCPGSKERLLEQKIPATYLALEDVVGYLALDRRLQGKDPVLRAEQYKMLVMHEMQQRFNIAFRDMAELNQATNFLHENGVLLHYEDATLKDLYFLDPQWLCDMLAHVVTIREINPFARNGIMKTEDLKHVFKSSQCAPSDAQTYILNLLNKFEVALTWDSRTLLIPSLLPMEEHLCHGIPGCDIRIPVRSKSWSLRKMYAPPKPPSVIDISHNLKSNFDKRPQSLHVSSVISTENVGEPKQPATVDQLNVSSQHFSSVITYKTNYNQVIQRLFLMSYFPSGFWPRLITRILGDDYIVDIVRSYFSLPKDIKMDPQLASVFSRRAEWVCWQTGMELRYMDTTLFRMKEILPHLSSAPYDYSQMKFMLQIEGNWTDVELSNSSILEILLPNQNVIIQQKQESYHRELLLEPSQEHVAKILAFAVDHIDTLLEDWYPTLGTRFVHTSEGRFLVTRVIPCTQCFVGHFKHYLDHSGDAATFSVLDTLYNKESWQFVDHFCNVAGSSCMDRASSWNVSSQGSEQGIPSQYSPGLIQWHVGSRGSTASHDSGVGPESNSSSRKQSAEGRLDEEQLLKQDQDGGAIIDSITRGDRSVYSFMVEGCILTAYQEEVIKCPIHGDLKMSVLAPDVVFSDLGDRFLVRSENLRRGRLLGRGAFGFVFKANIRQKGSNSYVDVAMKMLQPVDPGFGARHSDLIVYKAAWNKWQRDPIQYSCKAYCTARQELNILLTLRHPHIVPLVGVCTKPLALILQLAPQGALDVVLKDYRRSGARLDLFVLQKIIVQIAKALEYLHQQHIIYRDLKSENVLVWELPPPFHPSHLRTAVEVKLADYGISRSTLPTGTKGFGGTEGFMAPEIMKYNGEEEYTEKVDCFSFGMFMYELITLHLPFEGHECVKDHILEGGRPSLSQRETVYPSYMLDLMTLCWSQQPKDRPSTSHIVSIATAPEFLHLMDVISLHDNLAVLGAGALPLYSCGEGGEKSLDVESWEVWLSRQGKQLDLLKCNYHGWQNHKTIMTEQATITSMCIVENRVWLGDSRACIHVYSGSHHSELCAFSLDPDSTSHCAVRSMTHLPELGVVAIATSSGHLWMCSTKVQSVEGDGHHEEESTPSAEENMSERKKIWELGSNGNPIFCVIGLKLKECRSELWCGQTQASVTIFTLHNSIVTSQEVLNHFDPVLDPLDVTQLVANSTYVWSYIYPGCVVYLWEIATRTILHKLDCSKLAPCSESLMSISIEEHLSPGRCQVTAMATQGCELYIGTTWGCVIVAEGNSMRPVTVFRPFEEEVKAILPLSNISVSKDSVDNPPSVENILHPISLLATVGKGYRNLIGRYTSLPYDSSASHNSMYLILWLVENWPGS
ncbi:leucine-rich repeat kinase isoform X2 [Tachypleus tridentatus]|uniref:leucine-rich repeat kinase isoform X2 n=1 Tax=Tachypleus tridentatus TaxID=6853 RepID=UPI003FD01547